jgi:hypothetical protein
MLPTLAFRQPQVYIPSMTRWFNEIVIVVGGRLNGIGVAGLTLGGGEYNSSSWLIHHKDTEAYMRVPGYSWKKYELWTRRGHRYRISPRISK